MVLTAPKDILKVEEILAADSHGTHAVQEHGSSVR
jgi:hypothetical protein